MKHFWVDSYSEAWNLIPKTMEKNKRDDISKYWMIWMQKSNQKFCDNGV